MKILLIYPPRRDDSYIFPPTSLLYIAQAARSSGHEAEIIDIPYLLEKFPDEFSLLDNSLFDHIIQKDCDVLGLGGVVSTYFFYDYFVREYKKAKSDIPIIVGGSVGTPIEEVWAEHVPVDYLVEGDGELVIQEFLNCLENQDLVSIEKIPGLHHLKDGRYTGPQPRHMEDLDKLPFLNYDELDTEYYIDELSRWIEDVVPDKSLLEGNKIRALPFLTSRGCPFKCTFCFHFSARHQQHSVDYVIDNLRFLKDKYNINLAYIIDDLFIFDQKRTIELCEKLSRANLGMYFFGSGGKPSMATPEMLDAMKKAGFIRFSYGIESGSQKMLDVMRKKTTVTQNFRSLALTKEKNIPCFANLVMGMPGENRATIAETRQFLIDADLSTKEFYASWAVAYPGTPLFEWMKEEGMVRDTRQYLFEVGSIGNYIYNFSELSRKELKRRVYLLHREVDRAYYLKRRQYSLYLKTFLAAAVARIFFMIPARAGNILKTAIRKMLPRKKRRTVKRSSMEIEKWLESFRPEKIDVPLELRD